MIVRCWCDHAGWRVEVDGLIMATFTFVRFGQNAAFFAARLANEYRLAQS